MIERDSTSDRERLHRQWKEIPQAMERDSIGDGERLHRGMVYNKPDPVLVV